MTKKRDRFTIREAVVFRCRERPPCRSSDANGIGKNPLPRGEGGPRQRVGRGMRAGTRKSVEYNRPPPVSPRRRRPGGGLDISENIILPPAFLFSRQSVPRHRLATARNCGVIAPGNQWIFDSLRGAPPREKRFCATRRNAGDGVPYGEVGRYTPSCSFSAASRRKKGRPEGRPLA